MAEMVAAEPSGPAADPGDVVEIARALIATPSVNPALERGGQGESAIARLAAGWLRSWGYAVELVDARPGRTSLVARLRRGAGRSLILNGHLDTVGVGGMTVAPFAAEVRDGRLWGRGACDMKAGVAAILAAARRAAAGELRAGELIVALTADEEEAGIGCRRLVADGLRADAAVICEPTGLAIMPAHKGFTWLDLEFRGVAAHGSRPDRGVDAIRHAGLFLARLDALERALAAGPAHPLLGHGSVHAGTIAGGSAASVYPDRCRLTLERRTLPGEPAGEFRSEVGRAVEALRGDVPALDVAIEETLHRDGSEIPDDHPLVRAVAGAARSAGVEPVIGGMTAWVEAVVFNHAGVPALCFGPGRIEDAHSADEAVELDQLRAAERVLVALIGAGAW